MIEVKPSSSTAHTSHWGLMVQEKMLLRWGLRVVTIDEGVSFTCIGKEAGKVGALGRFTFAFEFETIGIT
ncbi:hypothetical protein M8494_36105 [Serratia ureilytica]